MSTVSQRSFSGGEVAPSLYARVDTNKYATGLKTCRNFYVMRHGGVANRPGTKFVGEVKDSSKKVRLIPFVFNASQTYALEFGHQYMRVIKDGEYVSDATKDLTITGISNASSCVVTYTGTDPSNGQEVYISGITGAIGEYLNNRSFKVSGVNAGSNTFVLQYMDGTTVSSTSFGSYTSGGKCEVIYEIATDYVEAHLFDLQYVQSADVITFTHPSYPPSELRRSADAGWTLTSISFTPSISAPTSPTNDGTYQPTLIISAMSSATPCKVTTTTAHSYSTGDEVEIAGARYLYYTSSTYDSYKVYPTTTFTITVTSATEFTIKTTSTGENFTLPGLGYDPSPAYRAKVTRKRLASGTENWVTEWRVTAVAKDSFEESLASASTGCTETPSASVPRTVSWEASSGAQSYNIYKKKDGVFGFIGNTDVLRFKDNGITPNTSLTPPVEKNTFKEEKSKPSCVGYYQQRRLFANSENEPEKIWATRSGHYTNLTQSNPIQDDDAVTWTMVGAQVNAVRHMVEVGRLVVLTSGGEWTIEGDSAGILRPTDINPKQHGYTGASTIKPIVVGGSVLYVQARGSIVRDLGYEYNSDGYRGNDLTIFSAHMFDKYTLKDWTFQQVPHSIVWAARSDGTLLGMTYVKEHQIVGWHRHDFDGAVESVCAVPEGTEDALYLVIKRTINGKSVRYVERFSTRQVNDIRDSVFMDVAASYDGRNTGSTTLTLSGGTDWTYTETLTLTASSGIFTADDVGNVFQITASDGEVIRFTVAGYTSSTVVTGLAHKTVPASLRSAAVTTWARAVDEISGLWHIEGKDVSILGDGFVIANPNNAAYVTRTVNNGKVTLDRQYAVVHVGLPVTADIETLNIDNANGETLADKKMAISKLTLFVESSRGVWAGNAPPSNDSRDPLEDLMEYMGRDTENYDEPTDLDTGTIEILIKPEWKSNGRVFVRQVDPLPVAVLAIAPAGLFPTGG